MHSFEEYIIDWELRSLQSPVIISVPACTFSLSSCIWWKVKTFHPRYNEASPRFVAWQQQDVTILLSKPILNLLPGGSFCRSSYLHPCWTTTIFGIKQLLISNFVLFAVVDVLGVALLLQLLVPMVVN